MKGESLMRIIGLITMSLWLSACSTAPMFPPAVTKGVEANTFDAKAWGDQAYHPSSAKFVSHKVELAGEIIKVIRKPDSIVILAEERPLEAKLGTDPSSVEEDGAPWFAITFKGPAEPSLLQAGNRLTVVGTTQRAGQEMLGGAPRMLPHLMAQCLHIWNTRESEPANFSYYGGSMGHHPAEERTFCLGGSNAGSSPGDGQGDVERASGGS
ncbi:MAG: Slp family lipoprotein [Nitrospira sp.]|nr:Slp family lipoprotein [Nitrospira sp.]